MLYGILTGEPWCLTPDQIARLTDWQIEHLYFEPARARAEEFRQSSGQSGQSGRVPPSTPRASGSITRNEYIRTATEIFGKVRDWGAEYDRLMKGEQNGRR